MKYINTEFSLRVPNASECPDLLMLGIASPKQPKVVSLVSKYYKIKKYSKMRRFFFLLAFPDWWGTYGLCFQAFFNNHKGYK